MDVKLWSYDVEFIFFLVADTQLYKRLFPSVGPSVRLSVVPSVRWSVMIQLKSSKTRIFEFAVVIVCMSECVWVGQGPGLDEGYTPTRTQLSCDPAFSANCNADTACGSVPC